MRYIIIIIYFFCLTYILIIAVIPVKEIPRSRYTPNVLYIIIICSLDTPHVCGYIIPTTIFTIQKLFKSSTPFVDSNKLDDVSSWNRSGEEVSLENHWRKIFLEQKNNRIIIIRAYKTCRSAHTYYRTMLK